MLFPQSRQGLHPDEITLAELLRERGYATGIVGKWHLGDAPEFLPTRQGFDSYFGIPYSNDMRPTVLMRGEQIIEQPVNQETLTKRYTEEAVKFIREKHDRPFFLFLAHTMPHTPLHVGAEFRGKSARGLYGDAIEQIDWSVGQVLDALAETGVDDRTQVIFSSDNGPWYLQGEHGGSATPLRSAKGMTYEGGMRVPFIARWPGKVPAGATCREMISQIDLLPTVARLIGAQAPTDRKIDGKDISPLLLGEPGARSPHEVLLFYAKGSLNAVRSGPWKLKFQTTLQEENIYVKFEHPDMKIAQALYNLETDIGEQKPVGRFHPDVVQRLETFGEAAREDLGDHRRGIKGKGVRPIGRLPEAAESQKQ